MSSRTPPERNPNLYGVLGLQFGASIDHVKKAFKSLALRHHPDKNRGADGDEIDAAAERFKQISEAYQILSNEERKAAFDARFDPKSIDLFYATVATSGLSAAMSGHYSTAANASSSSSSSTQGMFSRMHSASDRWGVGGATAAAEAAEKELERLRREATTKSKYRSSSKRAGSAAAETKYTAEQQEYFKQKERERQRELKKKLEKEREEEHERKLEAIRKAQAERSEMEKRYAAPAVPSMASPSSPSDSDSFLNHSVGERGFAHTYSGASSSSYQNGTNPHTSLPQGLSVGSGAYSSILMSSQRATPKTGPAPPRSLSSVVASRTTPPLSRMNSSVGGMNSMDSSEKPPLSPRGGPRHEHENAPPPSRPRAGSAAINCNNHRPTNTPTPIKVAGSKVTLNGASLSSTSANSAGNEDASNISLTTASNALPSATTSDTNLLRPSVVTRVTKNGHATASSQPSAESSSSRISTPTQNETTNEGDPFSQASVTPHSGALQRVRWLCDEEEPRARAIITVSLEPFERSCLSAAMQRERTRLGPRNADYQLVCVDEASARAQIEGCCCSVANSGSAGGETFERAVLCNVLEPFERGAMNIRRLEAEEREVMLWQMEVDEQIKEEGVGERLQFVDRAVKEKRFMFASGLDRWSSFIGGSVLGNCKMLALTAEPFGRGRLSLQEDAGRRLLYNTFLPKLHEMQRQAISNRHALIEAKLNVWSAEASERHIVMLLAAESHGRASILASYRVAVEGGVDMANSIQKIDADDDDDAASDDSIDEIMNKGQPEHKGGYKDRHQQQRNSFWLEQRFSLLEAWDGKCAGGYSSSLNKAPRPHANPKSVVVIGLTTHKAMLNKRLFSLFYRDLSHLKLSCAQSVDEEKRLRDENAELRRQLAAALGQQVAVPDGGDNAAAPNVASSVGLTANVLVTAGADGASEAPTDAPPPPLPSQTPTFRLRFVPPTQLPADECQGSPSRGGSTINTPRKTHNTSASRNASRSCSPNYNRQNSATPSLKSSKDSAAIASPTHQHTTTPVKFGRGVNANHQLMHPNHHVGASSPSTTANQLPTTPQRLPQRLVKTSSPQGGGGGSLSAARRSRSYDPTPAAKTTSEGAAASVVKRNIHADPSLTSGTDRQQQKGRAEEAGSILSALSKVREEVGERGGAGGTDHTAGTMMRSHSATPFVSPSSLPTGGAATASGKKSSADAVGVVGVGSADHLPSGGAGVPLTYRTIKSQVASRSSSLVGKENQLPPQHQASKTEKSGGASSAIVNSSSVAPFQRAATSMPISSSTPQQVAATGAGSRVGGRVGGLGASIAAAVAAGVSSNTTVQSLIIGSANGIRIGGGQLQHAAMGGGVHRTASGNTLRK